MSACRECIIKTLCHDTEAQRERCQRLRSRIDVWKTKKLFNPGRGA